VLSPSELGVGRQRAIDGEAPSVAGVLSPSELGVGRQRAIDGEAPSVARVLSPSELGVGPQRAAKEEDDSRVASDQSAVHRSASPETFLRLAWLANPLAYVGIYTLIAMMPGLSSKLGLTATEAGVYGSIWFFGRFLAFVLLWHWTAWHYRFRWLAAGYVLMIGGFVGCLLATSLAALAVAEVVFGLAVGLIYYSSLFYSMDVGTAKAEHGGWHEAMIGVGILSGPAVGALSLQMFPATPSAGGLAVGGLLAVGFGVMVFQWMWNRSDRRKS
jgi:hypothetical protein